MTEPEIMSAIESYVGELYSIWTIGVTDRSDERKQEHAREGKDVSCWHQLDASTKEVARRIEKYFLDKGCKGGGGGRGSFKEVKLWLNHALGLSITSRSATKLCTVA